MAAELERISASDDTLKVTAATSRICSAAVWQFRCLKCQISLKPYGDVLAW